MFCWVGEIVVVVVAAAILVVVVVVATVVGSVESEDGVDLRSSAMGD